MVSYKVSTLNNITYTPLFKKFFNTYEEAINYVNDELINVSVSKINIFVCDDENNEVLIQTIGY